MITVLRKYSIKTPSFSTTPINISQAARKSVQGESNTRLGNTVILTVTLQRNFQESTSRFKQTFILPT